MNTYFHFLKEDTQFNYMVAYNYSPPPHTQENQIRKEKYGKGGKGEKENGKNKERDGKKGKE